MVPDTARIINASVVIKDNRLDPTKANLGFYGILALSDYCLVDLEAANHQLKLKRRPSAAPRQA
jgi:hypothetical protein